MKKILGKIMNRYYSNKNKRHIKKIHENHQQRHALEYNSINNTINAFRQSGGLRHEYQAYKLFCIQRLLEQFLPNSILEFGSGSSTLIFSKYVRDNNLRLLSVDENEKWASNTRKLIGLEAEEKIQILSYPKKIIMNSDPYEIKYDFDIDEKYDFVFIDGPSLKINGVQYKNAINSNVFDLKYLPEVIVVDFRKATAEYIAKKYCEYYSVYLSDLFTGKQLEQDYNYFTYFVKK